MNQHVVSLPCKWENRTKDDGMIVVVWVPCSSSSCPDKAR